MDQFLGVLSPDYLSVSKKFQQCLKQKNSLLKLGTTVESVRISVSSKKSQHLDISYHAIKIQSSDRDKAVVNLLRYHDVSGAIVFCNTRAAVTHLASRLTNRGFSVVALSGELSQKERNFALQSMRVGKANVCVATDVAARGILSLIHI